ncbi:Synaptobrevin protein [Phytophthora nicotianae]|uniref:Synaptobrevin protein n=1 Tax=Phytophthora nicotianae TaxID=4792 RepID=A0A0W8DBG3_PHYNI|nr:Synaptobrevin protein [Phytophthora nicotianae]
MKIRYDEAVSEFQDRNSTLEAQLAAASSFGVIIPPDTARCIADLESQLMQSQIDLQVVRNRQSALASELRESATSHKAAQAEVTRLEAAIKRKNCRHRTLNDNYERRLRMADTTIATHTAELGRLQDRVSTLDRDLQKASQCAQAAISQRDQARAAHIATQDRVSAARDTIARLEKRINKVERSQKSRQDLESAFAKLQQERDDLAVQRDELLGQLRERFMEITDLRAERDQAQGKLSSIASLLPSATGHKRHALDPSLQPRLSVLPRLLDRLQAFPKLALPVTLPYLHPRSNFCLPRLSARGLPGRCHLLPPLVLLVIPPICSIGC